MNRFVPLMTKSSPSLHGARAHVRRIAAGVGFGLGEAESQLAAQHRLEKSFFLFVVAMKQHGPHFRPEQLETAKGQGSRARDLFVNNAARQESKTRAAVFRRHVEHPKPHRFGLFLKRLEQMLRHRPFAVVPVFALERNQLLIDEAANGVSEDLNFFG